MCRYIFITKMYVRPRTHWRQNRLHGRFCRQCVLGLSLRKEAQLRHFEKLVIMELPINIISRRRRCVRFPRYAHNFGGSVENSKHLCLDSYILLFCFSFRDRRHWSREHWIPNRPFPIDGPLHQASICNGFRDIQ